MELLASANRVRFISPVVKTIRRWRWALSVFLKPWLCTRGVKLPKAYCYKSTSVILAKTK